MVSGIDTHEYCTLFVYDLTTGQLENLRDEMISDRKFAFPQDWRMNNPAQHPMMVYVYEQFRYEFYHDWDKYSAAFFNGKAGSDGDTAVPPCDFGLGLGKDFSLGCKFMSGLQILFPDMEREALWKYGQEILQTKIKHTNQVENYLSSELYEQCEEEAIKLLPSLKRLHLRNANSKAGLHKICKLMGIKTDVANPSTSGIRTLFDRLKRWHTNTMTEQGDADSITRRNDWKPLEDMELAKMKFELEAEKAKAEADADRKRKRDEKAAEKAAKNAPKRAKIVEKLDAVRAGTYELSAKEQKQIGEDEDPDDFMNELGLKLEAALHKIDGTKPVVTEFEDPPSDSDDEDPPSDSDDSDDETPSAAGIAVRTQLSTYSKRLSNLSEADKKIVIDLDTVATDTLKNYRESLVRPNSVTAKEVRGKTARSKATWAVTKPNKAWTECNNKTFTLLFRFVHGLTSTPAFKTSISGTMRAVKPPQKLEAIKAISDKLNFGKVPSDNIGDWGKAAESWLHMYTGEQYLSVLTFLEVWVGSFHNLQAVVEDKMKVAEKVLAMKQSGFSEEEASHTLMVLWTIADLPLTN